LKGYVPGRGRGCGPGKPCPEWQKTQFKPESFPWVKIWITATKAPEKGTKKKSTLPGETQLRARKVHSLPIRTTGNPLGETFVFTE